MIANSEYAPLAALTPMVWLFVSLGALKMSTPAACLIGLAASAALAVFGWDLPPGFAALAMLDGAVFALVPIIWVILAALFTYAIAVETGAMADMKALLGSITPDRRIQALLIAWGFGGFMESVAGFGTAVVVPAAVLISLGFEPFRAALICLLANTVAVAFGVVGIPVTTLAWITDLPVRELSTDIVAQLFPFVFVVPAFIVLVVTRGAAGLVPVLPHTLVAGGAFGVAQFFAARHIGPELPAILGSLAAFGATAAMAKFFPPKEIWTFAQDRGDGAAAGAGKLGLAAQCRAWSPYIVLLILVLASRMAPQINALLAQATTSHAIYTGPGGKPLTIAWLLTPGTLVMVSAIVGGLVQGASPAAMFRLAGTTTKQMGKSVVTIVSIVALAKVLSYSGMIDAVAVALAAVAGKAYPFAAPVLGMLGTFITGSDTSSNILFGQLQVRVASSIGAAPVWIAAANTSGACIGKLISLQSIAIASIAADIDGREGELLMTAFRYALSFIVAMGILILVFA